MGLWEVGEADHEPGPGFKAWADRSPVLRGVSRRRESSERERRHDLKDSGWAAIKDLFPAAKATGRAARSTREVFNSALWILKTGPRWRGLPDGYGV